MFTFMATIVALECDLAENSIMEPLLNRLVSEITLSVVNRTSARFYISPDKVS